MPSTRTTETTRQAGMAVGSLLLSTTTRVLVAGTVLILALVLVGTWMLQQVFVATLSSREITRQQELLALSSSCLPAPTIGGTTTVAMPNLSAEQVALAHTIWTVAHQTGMGDEGAVVGIATSYQESTLGANLATRRPNSDVDVGPFQQRALLGWYAPGLSLEENIRALNDPATAARTFFLGHKVTAPAHAAARAAGTSPAGPVGYQIPGLNDIAGWRSMPVTAAAQAVQRSAYPTLYAKHEPMARSLVQRFNAEGAPPAAVAEVANPGLCDPPGAVDVANCPDSGLRVEQGLTPDAIRVVRCVKAEFPQLGTIGGVRPDSMPDHPSGRAVDIMFPGRCDPLGDQVAAWLKANAASMGVNYLIWCQKIWSVQRDREGWRAMSDRGSPTQNHMDHIHVTVNGNSAGTQAAAAAVEGGGAVSPIERYTLTARFGQAGRYWSSGYHTGLDFAAPTGTVIRAPKAGTVLSVSWHSAYGNLTKLDHGGGIESWYAHQSSTTARAGQRLAAGQEIGRVGETGNVTGAHLHMEVRRGGSGIDPDGWLRTQGVNLTGSRA